jgi:hypothetical protein
MTTAMTRSVLTTSRFKTLAIVEEKGKPKAMNCLQMIDFADHLAWDLIHNCMNAELGMMLVELSS